MFWLTKVVEDILKAHPEGEITVSSGVSPSGTYHVGTLREVMTAEAVAREVRRRGRSARHLHVADDLDVFRKVPAGLPEDYKSYLGKPLCDIPAPDGSDKSYADYFLADLLAAAQELHIEMEVVRAHEKYRSGFFAEAIEKALDDEAIIRGILEEISGHRIGDDWAPIQIMEDGYLKSRKFLSIDKVSKDLSYQDTNGQPQSISYADGQVKLNWRIDWPARWWLLHVDVEPFGRDHATKGGSYDTGAEIIRKVYGAEPPYPLPYDFVNKTGDTKKMSKSAGDVITAADLVGILPPEVVWFFMLKFPPEKRLFFDEGPTMIKLIDDFSALLSRPDKTEAEQQLLDMCMLGLAKRTVSKVPFSHLAASYQASLKDSQRTLDVIRRTEHKETVDAETQTIESQLSFIDRWLQKYAPEEVKFSLAEKIDAGNFSVDEKNYLAQLANKIEQAPSDADGEWFHQAIYSFKESLSLKPDQVFRPIYRAVIGKESGPRAGWFLSILPRDWLVKRLRLEE